MKTLEVVKVKGQKMAIARGQYLGAMDTNLLVSPCLAVMFDLLGAGT